MAKTPFDPFPAEAVPENKEGRLTHEQRARLGRIELKGRLGRLVIALACLGLAALVIRQGTFDETARMLYVLAAILIVAAGGFVWLAVVYRDAFSLDLREGRLETVEGAIGKHTRNISGERQAMNRHYLTVDGGNYDIDAEGYRASPDAGWVRIFVLPRSRRVVNLERLPGKPVPNGLSSESARALAAARLDDAVHAGDIKLVNEARAEIAAMTDSIAGQLGGEVAPPPPEELDPRPLAEAIVGTWAMGPATLTFRSDGTLSATLPGGRRRQGTWSVDKQGRLHSSATGEKVAQDAWVTRDTLIIADGSQGLTFKRTKAR